jgi:hypothetical protein
MHRQGLCSALLIDVMRRVDDRRYSLQQDDRGASKTWTMIHDPPKSFAAYPDQFLCRIGIHDLRLIEVVGGFGIGGSVEKSRCTRCGRVVTRRGA